ncbi:MAG: hypothetical protein R3F07_19980 [Opitutaceae bacterium]
MSSIILLRSENNRLRGRAFLSHQGRIFQRELVPRSDPGSTLAAETPDVIIAAWFSAADDLDGFLRGLCTSQSNTPVYLVAENLSPDEVISAVRAGARDVFLLPLNPQEILNRLSMDARAISSEAGIDPGEWERCCRFLQPESESEIDTSGPENPLEDALIRIESERQELELERQLLKEEWEQVRELQVTAGPAEVSDEAKRELERRASELEDQRYDFEEQKIFLMDAQREVEAARLAWEEERRALESSNEELRTKLEALQQGQPNGKRSGATPGPDGKWLRSSIGSLPLSKGDRRANGTSSSDVRELNERLNAANEARRGLEAELEEISRTAAQARASQVELEQEVADLRARYERTGEGGLASGGSLIDRLERLAESLAARRLDLEEICSRRSTLQLQIETLSAELSGQEITESLTPAHLQHIREVKNQRRELQDSEAALAVEQSRLTEDLERDERELLMIESWVEELDGARERIEALKRSHAKTISEPDTAFQSEPVMEAGSFEPPVIADPVPEKGRGRSRKGGLSRRFALRGMA